ncbi:hypothetical protein BZA05DRAFT_395509 [Tricharina praecox]|uniref:uncharacterized protein n=1 Tax=Tricharina praecox TaxID=43433 RepID=UPI00221E3F5F|nr:uncharacterized protein BZA05DRAFT_395509 [Tricharina praecox]KAI5854056.1 hypothetical protein BZA05DRAFT_395509 [Tricharina praecox]
MAGTGCCGATNTELSEAEDSMERTGDVDRDGGRMCIGVRMLWASLSSLATTITTSFLGATARLNICSGSAFFLLRFSFFLSFFLSFFSFFSRDVIIESSASFALV